MLAGLRARVSRLGGFTKDLGIRRYKRRAHINFSNHFRSTLEVAIINSYCTNYMGVTPDCYGTRSREDSSTVLVLWVCYLGNHFFLYRQSEARNVKYCYELHARSGLRFIIRHQEVLESCPQVAS